jgi:hypothetical protein
MFPYAPAVFDDHPPTAGEVVDHLRKCKEAYEALQAVHAHIFQEALGIRKEHVPQILRILSRFDHDVMMEVSREFEVIKDALAHFEPRYVVQLELLHALRHL